MANTFNWQERVIERVTSSSKATSKMKEKRQMMITRINQSKDIRGKEFKKDEVRRHKEVQQAC